VSAGDELVLSLQTDSSLAHGLSSITPAATWHVASDVTRHPDSCLRATVRRTLLFAGELIATTIIRADNYVFKYGSTTDYNFSRGQLFILQLFAWTIIPR